MRDLACGSCVVVGLMAGVVVAAGQEVAPRGVAGRASGEYGLTHASREERLPARPVIDSLDLEPGLTVLDLGAGKGYLTVPIAERLEGTGTVYATDVDAEALGVLRETVAARKLENVEAVQVRPDGVDPFYREHVFDRILLCQVLEYLSEPTAFLKELRPSLGKKGRLYVIHPKPVTGFGRYHFRNMRAILATLAARGEAHPVFQRLEPDLQSFVRDWNSKAPIPEVREAQVMAAFGQLLEDPTLYNDLARHERGTSGQQGQLFRHAHVADQELLKWLVVDLDASGAFAKSRDQIQGMEKTRLLLLNQILVTSLFRQGILRRYNVGNRSIAYYSRDSVVRYVEAAGYRLAEEHDVLRLQELLEFVRADE